MVIEAERAERRWAPGWREWCLLGMVAVAAVLALAVDVGFFKVVVAVFCVCLAVAKMWGDPRWRRGWRVRYTIACSTFVLAGLAADVPLYVFPLVCVPAGMACAAVERREDEAGRESTPSERQPT